MKYTRDQVDFRLLKEEEKDDAIQFCIKVFTETYTENTQEQNDQFAAAVTRPGYKESMVMYGLFLDGQMVGVTGFRPETNYWTVLYVDLKYQGRGLAKLIFRELIDMYGHRGPIFGIAKYNNLEMYKRWGMVPTDEPRVVSGMKVIPVVYLKLDDYFPKKIDGDLQISQGDVQ